MSLVDPIGDRMKDYERASRPVFPRRIPLIIRVDGKAFHTLTRHCDRPFDAALMASMDHVAVSLCAEIQGAQIAFVQSDEVSILVHGYKTIHTQPWLSNEMQKMCSVSASIATRSFNAISSIGRACFDSRVFAIPENDVCNYFIWRQQDATRNSIQMCARALFSDKQCHGKTCDELQEMLFQTHGINWNDLPNSQKRGRCAVRVQFDKDGVERHAWCMDPEVPIFTRDRGYIERHLQTRDVEATHVPCATCEKERK